jgi:hypothetical protein
MPRYIIERTFPDGLANPMTAQGAEVYLTVVGKNLQDNVTWIHTSFNNLWDH